MVQLGDAVVPVLNTAVGAHGPLAGHVNPFAVRGGGSSPKLRRDEHVATSGQLATILETIRPEWRALVLLATWTGLRYSEVVALCRPDVDLQAHVVRVRQSVSRSRAEGIGLKGPKSDAGVRDVHIPEHVMPEIRMHPRPLRCADDAAPEGWPLAPSRGRSTG